MTTTAASRPEFYEVPNQETCVITLVRLSEVVALSSPEDVCDASVVSAESEPPAPEWCQYVLHLRSGLAVRSLWPVSRRSEMWDSYSATHRALVGD